MRLLRPFLVMALAICALVSPVVAIFTELIGAFAPRGFAGHLHLLPGTPRSIFETRRMGLA